MAFEFKLPDIGEGVVEGEIVGWKVQVGDVVAEDQPLVEVMTDKATVEIPSPVAGTVVSTTGGEGDVVEVGAVIVVIQEGGEDTVKLKKAEIPTADPTPAMVERAAAAASNSRGAGLAAAVPSTAPPNPPPAASAPVASSVPALKLNGNNGGAATTWALPVARADGGKVLATPATRRLARSLGPGPKAGSPSPILSPTRKVAGVQLGARMLAVVVRAALASLTAPSRLAPDPRSGWRSGDCAARSPKRWSVPR